MAGPVNIAFGITAGSFQTGLDKMGSSVTQFTSLTRSQFESLKSIGDSPTSSVGKLAAQLGIANKNASPLLGTLGKLSSSGALLSPLTGALGGLFAVDKIRAFAAEITTTSGKFERFGSILTNALQSGSGAKDQLRGLTDFAANTPNQLDELTGSFIKFVNRGLIPSKEQLTNFGDLAASQGKGFDQLTEAILDAQTGEFERLKEFGVRASKSGDSVTLSFKGVTQTVKGTSEEITGAIQKFGQLTGVAGSMNAVAQTQEGLVSNLGDQYDRLLVALGQNGVAGGYRLALGAAGSFLATITDLIATSPVEDLRNQKTELNGLVGAIALANDNEALRLSLMQTLSQKYPEFLGKLNAESVTTDLLARRLADVNAQYDKKIRIALGEEKIKRATEEVTSAIRVQQSALEQLATASGKSLPELEKLTSKQRIELAKQIAQQKQASSLQPSYFGQSAKSSFDFLPALLESSAAKQKTAQAELNKLMGENATRQAELTKTTVNGYQAQIAQIQQKIKLKQVDAKLGAEEIARLTNQINTVQGKPAVIAPTAAKSSYDQLKADVDAAKDKIQDYVATHGINAKVPANLQLEYKNKAAALKAAEDAVKEITPKTVKASTAVVSLQQTGDLAILKRYAADLETTIQNLGGKAPEKLLKQLEDARTAIENLQALSGKNQRVSITGIGKIIDPQANQRVRQIVDNVHDIARTTPGLFDKTGAKDFFNSFTLARPSLEFFQNKAQEIKQTIATMSLNNLKVPDEVLTSLRSYNDILRQATNKQDLAEMAADPSRADQGSAFNNIFSSAGVSAGAVEKMQAQFGSAKDAVNLSIGQIAGAMESGRAQIRDAAIGLLSGLGESVSKGENPLKSALKLILDTLGKFVIQLGTALLFSSALLLAQAPLTFGITLAPGLSQKVAGVALIVGGAAIKGFAGSFEGGGLFRGERLIRVGESARALAGGGEFVAPVALGADLISSRLLKNLQKGPRIVRPDLQRSVRPASLRRIEIGGEFEISGASLRLVLDRHDENNSRWR